MKRLMILMLCAGLVLPFGGGQDLSARKRKKKEQTEQADTVKKETDYDKLMKEKPQTWKGFITVHKSKEKLYFEVPKTMLGREMLLGSIVSEISDNYAATAGTQPFNPLHIKFEQTGQKVNIVKVTKDYITDSDNPAMKENIDRNSAGSVIRSFKVHSYNADSSAVVFEVTDFFVGDEKSMRPFSPYGLYEMAGLKCTPIFQSDKSFLGECKAFDRNVNIKSYLSYTMSLNMRDGRSYVEDEPFTAQMTRSLILLDSIPYAPRRVDSRMAMFPTGKIRFNVEKQGSETVYFVNRWRMEPSDTAAYRSGKTVDPVKPIVFYIDPAFPAEWKDAIFQAVEMWQEPFEKIGFSNAILAKEYPTDDPAFDPDNILYSCIRYNPLGFQNAMGPSWVDPRSGEILTADVIWYHNIVSLLHNWRFCQTAATDPRVRKTVFDDEVMRESMRYVASHEIGHTLGLMHNMGASFAYPVDSLRSPSFTQKYGTTPSIMDYARNNYVAQPGDLEKGVRLVPPLIGVYDKYAIDWGYRIFPGDLTPEEEKPLLNAMIDEKSGDPMYTFGAQQIFNTVSPVDQTEDLGNDHIKAGDYAISNMKIIVKNMEDWLYQDGADYMEIKIKFYNLATQYMRHLYHVFPYIGGVKFHDFVQGDGTEHVAREYIDKATQKRAMEWVVNQVLTFREWMLPPRILDITGYGSGDLDGHQRSAAAKLFSPVTLTFIAEGERSGQKGLYTLDGYLKDAVDICMASTLKRKNLTIEEMNLQNAMIAALAELAGIIKPEGQALSLAGGSSLAEDLAAMKKSLEEMERVASDTGFCSCSGHDNLDFSTSYFRQNNDLPTLSGAIARPAALKELKRILNTYKNARGSANARTKAFYDYQIDRVERAMKQ